MKLSERFQKGFELAFELHGNHERKGSGVPYMGHLLGVTAIVIDDGGTENEAIAALLHDGPEDQGGLATLERIRRDFGDEVADIVKALSDTFEEEKPEWKQRKEDYLDKLRQTPDDDLGSKILRVSLADKIYNVRAIAFDYDVEGEKVWDRFSASMEDSLWYYKSLGEVYSEKLGSDGPLIKAYLRDEANLRSLGQ